LGLWAYGNQLPSIKWHAAEHSGACGVSQDAEGVSGVTKPEEYRELAAHCVRLTSEIKEENQRALLLEMAQRWLDLADQVERAEIVLTRNDDRL
jgi:hypothetical protein